jgi:hypothetical protein
LPSAPEGTAFAAPKASVAVIVAPGTSAPDSSVITPRKVPSEDRWAIAVGSKAKKHKAKRKEILWFILNLCTESFNIHFTANFGSAIAPIGNNLLAGAR